MRPVSKGWVVSWHMGEANVGMVLIIAITVEDVPMEENTFISIESQTKKAEICLIYSSDCSSKYISMRCSQLKQTNRPMLTSSVLFHTFFFSSMLPSDLV